MEKFYLGSTDPSWIGRSPAPLMVNVNRPLSKWPRRAALNGWFCDSGAFTHINKHGRWTRTPAEHVELVRTFADRCPGLEYAAPMDWMCEPFALARTGLTVIEHQRRTVANLLELRSLAPEIPWVPVLQGYEVNDYLACANMYDQAGIDLRGEPLVGVGSVCRRQNSDEIELVFYNLWLQDLKNTHGFGVKLYGLDDYQQYIKSADSTAWAASAKWRPNICGNLDHKSCSSCYVWAHQWYEKIRVKCGLAEV